MFVNKEFAFAWKPCQQDFFNNRNQQDGESILNYVAELKRLTSRRNFAETLSKTLRDKLVCGDIQDKIREQIRKRLLAEAKLKYVKAFEIAVATETATRDAAGQQADNEQVK